MKISIEFKQVKEGVECHIKVEGTAEASELEKQYAGHIAKLIEGALPFIGKALGASEVINHTDQSN